MATQADGDNDDLPHADHSPLLSTITGFATNKHLSAKECGKQRAVPQEEEDVTQAAADESQWRAGVNRQSQPTAHEHQLAASKAAAAKRTANAMPAEERKEKRAARRREVTAQKATERAAAAGLARQAAAAARVPTHRQLNRWLKEEGEEELCDADEWDEFESFTTVAQDVVGFEEFDDDELDQDSFLEFFSDWRHSDEYVQYKIDNEINNNGEQEQEDHSWGDDGEFSEQDRPSDYDSDAGWGNACLGNASPCQPSPPPPDGDPSSSSTALENGDDPHVSQPLPPPHPPHLSLPRGVSTDDWWDRQAEAEYVRQEQLAIRDNARRALQLARTSLSPHEQRMQREQAAGLPPRRDQIQYGERGDPAGDQRFRADRESWYERFTGQSITTVSLQEQNELCDVIARRYRAYSDGRV